MRLLSAGVKLVSSAILVSLLTNGVASRPSPDPKASWVRTRGKKNLLKNSKRWSNDTTAPTTSAAAAPSCVDSNATSITAPKDNIWGGLTDLEASSVVSWLFDQPELNLTISEDAGEWDNSVLLVELLQPNKTDVLKYLDGNGTAPTRYAHVVLDHRATVEPYYADIMVGPLPLVNGTAAWTPLEYPYTRKTQGRVRNLDADSETVYTDWLYKISATVSDITLDLWGATALGLDNDTIDIWGIDPLWQDDGRIIRWDTFWNLPTDEFDVETLLPLGLFFRSDVTGRDPSKWKLEGWLYNNVFYETTEDFRAAYFSPGFVKLGTNVEGDWARTDQSGPILPMDPSYPPTMVAPTGARYAVDAERKYVQWMDFSFYVSFSRDLGMTLHDIRYKGKRIIYELGLQEALAHYAGKPSSSETEGLLEARMCVKSNSAKETIRFNLALRIWTPTT